MRILAFVLILALSFGGFSTASHAFESQKCGQDSAHHTSADKNQSSSDDCAGLSAAQADADKNTQDGTHLCFACGHSCASHAALPYVAVALDVPTAPAVFVLADVDTPDAVVSGLKRPPKFLG